jgi:arsenite methyltransferase
VFLGPSPHPWAPSLATIMAEQFTPEDRQFFEKMVRPTVESGNNPVVDRIAYMNATKPCALGVLVDD